MIVYLFTAYRFWSKFWRNFPKITVNLRLNLSSGGQTVSYKVLKQLPILESRVDRVCNSAAAACNLWSRVYQYSINYSKLRAGL